MSLDSEILINFDEFESSANNKKLKEKKSKTGKKVSKNTKGGYKLVSVDLETLKNESEFMETEISKLIAQWKDNKELSDQDVVSLYIIIYLNKRHPTKFLESINEIVKEEYNVDSKNLTNFINITSNNIKQRLKETKTITVFELINKFNLHGIPKASRIALVKWYSLINAFKRVFKLNENEHLNGDSLEEFNKNFEIILDLFEMNEIQKESSRCVLSSTNQRDQFNSFDFNILNDYFLN